MHALVALLTLALLGTSAALPEPHLVERFEERCKLDTTGQYTPCYAGPGTQYKIVQELPPGGSYEFTCTTNGVSVAGPGKWDLTEPFNCYVQASVVVCTAALPSCGPSVGG